MNNEPPSQRLPQVSALQSRPEASVWPLASLDATPPRRQAVRARLVISTNLCSKDPAILTLLVYRPAINVEPTNLSVTRLGRFVAIARTIVSSVYTKRTRPHWQSKPLLGLSCNRAEALINFVFTTGKRRKKPGTQCNNWRSSKKR